MYAEMTHFSVKSGILEEAAKVWREAAPPAGEGQPGFKVELKSTISEIRRIQVSILNS
jgi:hypothetical protein